MSNFIEDLNYGLCAKEKALEILKYNKCQVRDMTSDIKAKKDGYDFVLEGLKTPKTIIVKADSYADSTGNMVYETKSGKSLGCMEKSKADFLFYITKNHAYMIDLKKLRKFIKENYLQERAMGDNAKGYFIRLYKLQLLNIAKELKQDVR